MELTLRCEWVTKYDDGPTFKCRTNAEINKRILLVLNKRYWSTRAFLSYQAIGERQSEVDAH